MGWDAWVSAVLFKKDAKIFSPNRDNVCVFRIWAWKISYWCCFLLKRFYYFLFFKLSCKSETVSPHSWHLPGKKGNRCATNSGSRLNTLSSPNVAAAWWPCCLTFGRLGMMSNVALSHRRTQRPEESGEESKRRNLRKASLSPNRWQMHVVMSTDRRENTASEGQAQ